MPSGSPRSCMVAPTQTLLASAEASATGASFTVMVTVSVSEQPEELVTVRVYSPSLTSAAFAMEGSWRVLTKELGPVQE